MIHVLENQIALDQHELGFPSIAGCHALVLHTTAGLYGFHIYGTPAHFHSYTGEDIWDRKSGALSDFVSGHHGQGKAVRLYSPCFRGKRGYSAKGTWKGEVKAYATRLRYKGKVRCFDLDKMG